MDEFGTAREGLNTRPTGRGSLAALPRLLRFNLSVSDISDTCRRTLTLSLRVKTDLLFSQLYLSTRTV